MPSFPPALVPSLQCPVCASGLTLTGPSLRCERGHSFDLARQGYVHLGARPLREGDTPQMVQARARFLSSGHYEPLALRLGALLQKNQAPPGPLVEIGAGTGYYLSHLLESLPGAQGLAVDLSRAAAKHAAAAHPRIGALVADAEVSLPIRDAAVSVALSAFAPRPKAELSRIVRGGGLLLAASAGPGHLAELRAAMGLMDVAANKPERLAARMTGAFERTHEEDLRYARNLSHEEVTDLIAMGPNAFHLNPQELEARLADLPAPLNVQVHVQLGVYRRTGG